MMYSSFWKKILLFCGALVCVLLLRPEAGFAAETITINVMLVNNAPAAKEFPVHYELPKELDSSRIVDAAGLKVDYDIARGIYYLSGSVPLAPKESRVLKIEVQDVWRVTPQETNILKQQLTAHVQILENTEFHETAQLLSEQMISQLDYILSQQERYEDNVERRIENYKANLGILNKIRDHAFSPDYLRKEARTLKSRDQETLRFVIEVKNTEDKPKDFLHQHYLPAELASDDVLEAEGFDIRYNDVKQQVYLSKEETLPPGKEQRYEIIVRDIWKLPQPFIDDLREQATAVVEGLQATPYEDSAEFLFAEISRKLQAIESSRGDKSDIKKYIGAFRANQQRLQEAQNDLQKLEDMLSVVNAQKLAELRGEGGTLQRLRALTGISSTAVAIFGAAPSLTMTWRVILGIVVFLAFFTGIHFFTWLRRSQIMGEGEGIQPGESFKMVLKTRQPKIRK